MKAKKQAFTRVVHYDTNKRIDITNSNVSFLKHGFIAPIETQSATSNGLNPLEVEITL